MKLHYSQTIWGCHFAQVSFSTLWNYTTLKRFESIGFFSTCFSTLWNYTTLKPLRKPSSKRSCFSTLWNYTTLKHFLTLLNKFKVSVPYEITLLSNGIRYVLPSQSVSVPYEITLLSNVAGQSYIVSFVSVPYEITLLSNQIVDELDTISCFSTLWNYTTLKL